jgi:serine phosphatase RsbU (regulator of sigma subunit)
MADRPGGADDEAMPRLRSPLRLARHPSVRDRNDGLGFALGMAVVIAASLADMLTPARAFPLTAVLLGPLLASALAGPVRVAVVGVVSVASAIGLAAFEHLPGVEGWARIVLVLAAAAASLAVAHLRTRHERDLVRAGRVASLSLELQRGLLPSLRSTPELEVRAVYRPSSEDLVLAGDFIDVVPFPHAGPGAVAFCVSDVTGHDAAAAGLGASLRAAWRTLALSGGDPTGWLQALDRFVRAEVTDEMLATVCVGVLDPATRRLAVASAGHPRPVLLSDHAEMIDVDAGPPLGLPVELGASTWETAVVGLDTDFGVVLYTDGLVEGRRAPGSPYLYGEESLTAWLDSSMPAHGIDEAQLERLVADILAANGAPLVDDVAVVVLAGRAGHVLAPQPPHSLEDAVPVV